MMNEGWDDIHKEGWDGISNEGDGYAEKIPRV